MKRAFFFFATIALGLMTSCDEVSELFPEEEIFATAIELDKSSVVLAPGETVTLTATLYPENVTRRTIEWGTSDWAIATVKDGVVTAVGVGETEVQARIARVEAVCKVIVRGNQGVPVTSLEIDRTELEMKVGDTETLYAKILPENATDQTVTWASSDDKVVTVTQEGKVTAVGAGKTTITITTNDGSNLTATCTVTVTETAAVAPRLMFMTHDNNGNNYIYVDGKLFCKTTDIVYDIDHDGTDIYYYVYNDGFYKETQKVVSFDNTNLTDARFEAFIVKDGVIYTVLKEKSGSNTKNVNVRVHAIDVASGKTVIYKLNTSGHYNVNFGADMTPICVDNNGKIYVLGTVETSSGYSTATLWTITPSGSEAKVEETALFKASSDMGSNALDIELGEDGNVYALVGYYSKSAGEESVILYKNMEEVRRYTNCDTSYQPHEMCTDGQDVYLILKRSSEKVADIYKNGDKILGDLSNCQSGTMAPDGKGGYYYSITQTGELYSRVYSNSGVLVYSYNAMVSKMLLAK